MIYKILVLLLILNSCGVEVGNPQQPTPVPVPSGQPIEDSNTLAAISADGINDMNQAIVNTNNSQSSSFALIQVQPLPILLDISASRMLMTVP